MQLTILKISRKPTTTKYGEKTSVGILTQEYVNKWINGFGDANNLFWKQGDIVEAAVTQNGEYLNFKAIKPSVAPNMPVAQGTPSPEVQNAPYSNVPPPLPPPPPPPPSQEYEPKTVPVPAPKNNPPNWDKIREEKANGMAWGNAKTNATNIALAYLDKDELKDNSKVQEAIKFWANWLYELETEPFQ